ncbi:hypothetical protein OAI84_00080 [bacterium]|nr:hypothetical protein [bacterium]
MLPKKAHRSHTPPPPGLTRKKPIIKRKKSIKKKQGRTKYRKWYPQECYPNLNNADILILSPNDMKNLEKNTPKCIQYETKLLEKAKNIFELNNEVHIFHKQLKLLEQKINKCQDDKCRQKYSSKINQIKDKLNILLQRIQRFRMKLWNDLKQYSPQTAVNILHSIKQLRQTRVNKNKTKKTFNL